MSARKRREAGVRARQEEQFKRLNDQRSEARTIWVTDDLEIDPGAEVIDVDDGFWVAAWVFVHEERKV